MIYCPPPPPPQSVQFLDIWYSVQYSCQNNEWNLRLWKCKLLYELTYSSNGITMHPRLSANRHIVVSIKPIFNCKNVSMYSLETLALTNIAFHVVGNLQLVGVQLIYRLVGSGIPYIPLIRYDQAQNIKNICDSRYILARNVSPKEYRNRPLRGTYIMCSIFWRT